MKLWKLESLNDQYHHKADLSDETRQISKNPSQIQSPPQAPYVREKSVDPETMVLPQSQ